MWFQTYPRAEQPNPHSLFGGISTHGTGRYDRAIEASRREIAADPDFGVGYGNLAGSYFLTGRFAEAERTIQAASERKVEFDRLFVIRYNIAVLKGDQEQMDRSVALARGKRRLEHWIAHAQSLALARSGRLQAARRSSNRALELALQEGRTRGGGDLPGRTSDVGSPLRECWRSDKKCDGSAGAFERPGG